MFKSVDDINLIVALIFSSFSIISFLIGRRTTDIKEDAETKIKQDKLFENVDDIKETLNKLDKKVDNLSEENKVLDKRLSIVEFRLNELDKNNNKSIT